MRPWVRRGGFAAGGGAAFGAALFAWEAALVLRSSGVGGLNIDVKGPLAALLAAVRPHLPALISRIAAIYLVAGAVLGLIALVLTAAWLPRRRRAWALIFTGEWVVLAGLIAWNRAVARPALFDDLWPTGLLTFLVDHGQPWHPVAVAVLWCTAHAALGWRAVVRLRRPFAAAAVGAASLLLLGALGSKPKRPLVVVIGIDAFRPDRLAELGGKGDVAPNLEAFAKDATLFTHAYTPIAQTQPAWRGLLTARWPFHTGVRYPMTADKRWRTGLSTFPRAFSQAGYQTTFWTDCSRFNYQGPSSGFASDHEPPRGALNFILEKLRFRGVGLWADNPLGAWWLPEMVDNRALAGIHNPIAYAHRLADHLASEAERGPTLFAFHATAAHFPGDPVFPFYRKYVSASEPLERRIRMTFAPITATSTVRGDRQAAEGLYDELLSQADQQLGIILDALRSRGLYDDALVVVFSDHGESFHSDTPELEGATPVHGARLSEEENRILLLIKPPKGQPHVASVDALVRLIDLGPTLLDLAGLPALDGADGVSLAPLLRGQPMAPMNLYAETGFTHAAPDAFDPEHLAAAPRTFDAYQVRPDGVIEMSDAAHEAIMREKDIGAFDGRNWLIRSPRKDGTVQTICRGECADGSLERWLDQLRGGEG